MIQHTVHKPKVRYVPHIDVVDIKSKFSYIVEQQNLSKIREIFEGKEEMMPVFTDWINRKISLEEANKKMHGELPCISSRILKEIIEV